MSICSKAFTPDSAAALPPTFLHARSVVQQLSTLQLLRNVDVNIDTDAARTDAMLSSLRSGLTRLQVFDMRWPEEEDELNHLPGPATFPAQMPQLSTLQELSLQQAVIHPSMLSHLSHPQRMCLYECSLLPLDDDGDAAAAMTNAAGKAAAVAAFLAAVGRMTNLRGLEIENDMWDHPGRLGF
jgi:hypothetical protein